MAAKIQFTPGTVTPSASGLWSIQFDSTGKAYRVDDAGNAYLLQGMTTHNDLASRNAVDCHPQSAITGLVAALTGKEPGLGNPSVDGMHLASTAAGVRSWVAPPARGGVFSAINDTMQSFGSPGVTDVLVEWDSEILKHASKFSHSESTDPEIITISFTGWVMLDYTVNWQTDESNRILTKCWIERTRGATDTSLAETITYGYMRNRSYVDVCTNSLAGIPIAVQSGDKFTLFSQHAYNDDVATMPDANNDVYTRVGESHITLIELIDPEG